MAFDEVPLPEGLARGARGGPRRRTQVVALASGHEERNTNWADSRREWNLGYGLTEAADLHALIAFFEDRRGRLHGFRFRDFTDDRSSATGTAVSPTDQAIGTGDGAITDFQLVKAYGSATPWTRTIAKPVAGTVRVALDGVEQTDGWGVSTKTGIVSFATPPAVGVAVTAGFMFDTPVRFDTDSLDMTYEMLIAGEAASVPIVEIRNFTNPASTSSDPHWDSVAFLFGFDGEDGSDVFVDEGPNDVIVMPFGAAAISSNAQVGTGALLLSGEPEDYLDLGTPEACQCDFGTGDFTVECWFNSTENDSGPDHHIVGNYAANTDWYAWGLAVQDNPSNTLRFIYRDESVDLVIEGTTNVGAGWHHAAVSRNDDVIRLFVDGVMEAKQTGLSGKNVSGTENVLIGDAHGSEVNWHGYIDELRVTNGVGRYDSDSSFTPSTAKFPRAD